MKNKIDYEWVCAYWTHDSETYDEWVAEFQGGIDSHYKRSLIK